MSDYRSTFKDLQVWQRSRKLVGRVYEITDRFPGKEQFGLTGQLRRAAVSIPSNIAEGHRRGSNKEFQKFLVMARGSLAEVETQLILALDLKFLEESETEVPLQEIEEIGKMINGLIKSLD
jgi:four helix bundle protein